jgi:hypothetical protein
MAEKSEADKLVNEYYECFHKSVPIQQMSDSEVTSKIKEALRTGQPIKVSPDSFNRL